MNSHELARQLLSGPDAPVLVWDGDQGIWCRNLTMAHGCYYNVECSIKFTAICGDNEEGRPLDAWSDASKTEDTE